MLTPDMSYAGARACRDCGEADAGLVLAGLDAILLGVSLVSFSRTRLMLN